MWYITSRLFPVGKLLADMLQRFRDSKFVHASARKNRRLHYFNRITLSIQKVENITYSCYKCKSIFICKKLYLDPSVYSDSGGYGQVNRMINRVVFVIPFNESWIAPNCLLLNSFHAPHEDNCISSPALALSLIYFTKSGAIDFMHTKTFLCQSKRVHAIRLRGLVLVLTVSVGGSDSPIINALLASVHSHL
jgi:hypothetical protein